MCCGVIFSVIEKNNTKHICRLNLNWIFFALKHSHHGWVVSCVVGGRGPLEFWWKQVDVLVVGVVLKCLASTKVSVYCKLQYLNNGSEKKNKKASRIWKLINKIISSHYRIITQISNMLTILLLKCLVENWIMGYNF